MKSETHGLRLETRLLLAGMAIICIGLHRPILAADKPGWRLGKTGDTTVNAATASGHLAIRSRGVRGMSKVVWKDAFQHLRHLSLTVHLRSGHMYHLYSLNELRERAPIRTTQTQSEVQGSKLVIVSHGAARGVKITSEVTADAERNEIQMRLKLLRTEPELARRKRHGRKFQLQYQVRYWTEGDPAGMALVLPTPKRFTVLRPHDESGQEIYSQDRHLSFPKTARLLHPYGILASTKDRKGIFFTGTNLRHVRARMWPRSRYFCFYGNEALLGKGEEHVESFTLRLINGVGGAGFDKQDSLAGKGALLAERCVTSGDSVPVYFTCPGTAFRSEVRVTRAGKTLLTQSGDGDIALDVSKLADGAYNVLKRITARNRKLESEEELRILKATYQDFDTQVRRIRSFIQGFNCKAYKNPDVARIRIGLIKFKLDEVEAYRPFHEIRQIRGLLKDAARAMAALKKGEPARMPGKTELIYANDLSEDTGDFYVFGNGRITFSPERGMYLDPIGTMNLWTRFQVAGPYMVEFDYFPGPERADGTGGTMLQLSGNPVNPVSDYSLMPSASWGSMVYYMFGVKCYHFSFSRGGGRGRKRVCNFRKTGKGFYVLSRIPDPIMEMEKWHHLAFVKDRNHFMFFVNNRLVQEYFDEGNQGPFLDAGHIGIRNWTKYKSYFKNFQVHRIAP